jgi:tetratricopeptide (TPR) repeat protein
MWTPKYPLNPGDSQLFLWQRPTASPLAHTSEGIQIRMQNHLGTHGVEQFYLVVPSGRKVIETSNAPESKTSAGGYDIHCFQREVTPETNNIVTAVVAPAGPAKVDTQPSAAGAAPSPAEKRQAEDLSAEGWRLWGQRKLAQAEAKFAEAIAKDATNANIWNGLGWAQLNQGKRVNARESFERAVALDPKAAASWNGLGWIEDMKARLPPPSYTGGRP